MLHAALITVHAGAGAVALVAGSLSIRRRGFLPVYFWSLVVCIVSLATAIAYDWNTRPVALRAVFTGLAGLGALVVWEGHRHAVWRPPTPPCRRHAISTTSGSRWWRCSTPSW